MGKPQPSLFDTTENTVHRPLAERMRPVCLQDLVGQEHLVSQESAFFHWIQQGGVGNVLLYGPPGCGKTSLAQLMAHQLHRTLITVNAVLSNLGELRECLKQAEQSQGNSLLFIDEIHRFNRSQQDALLPFCETGRVQLIGATTRHPAFYLIPPLLSRSYLFELKALESQDIIRVLKTALKDSKNGLGTLNIEAEEEAIEYVANATQGDLRRALNLLEYLCLGLPIGSRLQSLWVQKELKQWKNVYNARESDHYDCISAFIKSVRGSDPDAALYWLARMLKGGEDPLYVARRLMILASEDVGLADSRGLNLASSAYLACEKIGMPECAIPLSHVTLFLTLAPKSNSAYMAWNAACDFVTQSHLQTVPDYLRAKALKASDSYLYSHNFEANVSGQKYWDEDQQFYHLKPVGAEQNFLPLYKHRRQLKENKVLNVDG
ncbi:MAG: replication-associated recombination protein A [Puniceicoccales bacterium]|jgi:putative ATPase|nr:replication-associated recombination protein A [Puniceicoccales bacterium]